MNGSEDTNHDLGFSVCAVPTPGRTNTLACNYNPSASIDDGSCILPDGCSNISACNLDLIAACDDGNREYTTCARCTYPDATNYDLALTLDDGSCLFEMPADCQSDFNDDHIVNAADLLFFLGTFRSTSAP
jgi:hypothetical protein